MAGEVKISALPLAGAAQDADITAGVQSGTTVKQTNSALYTYIQGKIASVQVTNGVNYFNGTQIVSGNNLTWNGADLTVSIAAASASSVVATTTTGVSNFAISHVSRGDQANGLAGYQLDTNAVGKWLNGIYPGSAALTANPDDLIFRSFSGSQVVMSLGQTSYDITIQAGNLILSDVTKTIQIDSLTASQIVVTDSNKKLISGGTIPGGFINYVTSNSASVSAAIKTLYYNVYAAGQATFTLPTASGSNVLIGVLGVNGASASGWRIQTQSNDKIQLGTALSSANGSLYSTVGSATDCVFLIDVAVNLWVAFNVIGNSLTVD